MIHSILSYMILHPTVPTNLSTAGTAHVGATLTGTNVSDNTARGNTRTGDSY